MSRKKRQARLDAIKDACREYIQKPSHRNLQELSGRPSPNQRSNRPIPTWPLVPMIQMVRVYSVLVAKGGKILLERGYGMANIEWDLPNTPVTKFRVGSLTKPFTAAAILQLQEMGKLSVSDPACKYFDGWPERWRKIAIHQLLSHTSGIPSYTDDPEFRSPRRMRIPLTPSENPSPDKGRGLGEAIKGRRHDVIVATKAFFRMGSHPNQGGTSRHHLIAACEASLKRLGTDYIDLYQHAFNAQPPVEERSAHWTIWWGRVKFAISAHRISQAGT